MAEVQQRHREAAVEAWRQSNDPAGENFGPELIAQAIAAAESRGAESAGAELLRRDWEAAWSELPESVRAELGPLPTESAGAWIPCSERMPKESPTGEFYWVYTAGAEAAEQMLRLGGWFTTDGSGVDDDDVTHWMPIRAPAPPAPTTESK